MAQPTRSPPSRPPRLTQPNPNPTATPLLSPHPPSTPQRNQRERENQILADTNPIQSNPRRRSRSKPPEMKFFSAFDPWPVFFRREWGRTWPFLAGFAVTGALITKMTAGFTEEDLKNSKFVQAHKNK
ncbi:hypothetical protein VPH35_000494 [Triticum aestivum]